MNKDLKAFVLQWSGVVAMALASVAFVAFTCMKGRGATTPKVLLAEARNRWRYGPKVGA